jgi:hypothetical protein
MEASKALTESGKLHLLMEWIMNMNQWLVLFLKKS